MIVYIFFNPALIGTIRQETSIAVSREAVDIDHITQRCPMLRSIAEEILRLTAYSASTRYISSDTIIGGKTLRKGNRIMMPFRQIHRDMAIWGDKPQDFDPERFLKNPKLKRFNMAFGGGATQCPGQHLAVYSMMLLAAIVVNKFDVQLDPPGQKFPEQDLGELVLGLAEVKKSMDVMVKLVPRNVQV